MALKKPTTPAFEQEPTTGASDETAVVERPKTVAPAATIAADSPVTPAAAKEANLAVVAASQTSLSVNEAAAQAKAFQKEVEAMRGASDFAYGNYAQFKGNNGTIIESGDGGADLGRWAQVRMISWDKSYQVSPSEKAGNTKDFVAFSKDGKTVDKVIGEEMKEWVGKPVDAYVTYLQTEEGFKNASSREFVDIACALMACESGDGPIGTVIQVTLSASSIPAFSRYQQSLNDTARCVAMGLPGFKLPADPFGFYFIRELASKGDNKWTKLKIVSTLPAKI